MAESIDPDTVFPVYPICVYSGICRSEIHIYTDRCRGKGCHDLFRDSAGCDLHLYDPVRKILLRICLCIWDIGRCSTCFVPIHLGDGVHALYVWICKKMKKKPLQIAEAWTEKLCYLKYIVLALISILCFAGVYSKAKGTSPWDVFSMLHAGNFKLGGYLVGLVLLVLILVGMCFEERFFCRNFCPMGAVFSLLPVLPFFALHRDRENCIKGCKACTKKCPSNIGLPEDGSPRVEGDCFQCQKCIDTCPKGNIHTSVKGICGNEFWFTILRAVILLILLLWLGV